MTDFDFDKLKQALHNPDEADMEQFQKSHYLSMNRMTYIALNIRLGIMKPYPIGVKPFQVDPFQPYPHLNVFVLIDETLPFNVVDITDTEPE